MKTISTDRMFSSAESDAIAGSVRWVAGKSIWTLTMLTVAVVGAPVTFSWGALALFLASTAVTICAGHSVGMHRLLIHRSFRAPKWIEHILVYLGTLVGMAGPFGMIAAHDIRDWAQRQTGCHDLYAHRNGFWRDCWWQMHSAVALDHPPRFLIEDEVLNDKFYRFLERTWMLQQLPWAILFFALGGWSWVIWGIAVRVTMSLHGHWLVGHFAHRRGQQNWSVDDVAVQGYNIPHISLLTFGENWHGNHHAYPGSARLGMAKGELDPGWWLIKALQWIGLAWNVKEPRHVGDRKGLRRLDGLKRRYPKKLSLFGAWVTATVTGLFSLCYWLSISAGEFLGDTKLLIPVICGIGMYAGILILLTAVPAVRLISVDAATDSKHGLIFYAAAGAFVGVASSVLISPILTPAAALLILPPAILSGLVFGVLNKRAIRKFLAHQAQLA